tara:strand:+ start:743 stop:1471 length:729 start_codon:yes stop_codon:yes gene_type:complete
MKELTIYIISSDKSIHSIEALQYFVNKFWKPNPKVVVLSYKQPETFELADNFKVVSMGKDRGHDYVNKNMIKFFNSIEDSHFIFSLDDFIPMRTVDTEMLNTLTQKVIDEDISRFILIDQFRNKSYTTMEECDGYNILEMSQNSPYRVATPWSIWSKEYFLKHLSPNGNLWTWERGMYRDGHKICGTNGKQVIQSVHLFKQMKLKGNWYQDVEGSDVMCDEDKKILENYISKWKDEGAPQLV